MPLNLSIRIKLAARQNYLYHKQKLFNRLNYCAALILVSVMPFAMAADEKVAVKQQESERTIETANNTADVTLDKDRQNTEGKTQDNNTSEATKQKRAVVKKTKESRNSDVFRPSEEISEDFAVSFPVDI